MSVGTVIEMSGLRLRLIEPAERLRPYITAYYRTEALSDEPIEDWLPPEWANVRVGSGTIYQAAIGDQALRDVPLAVVSGPTSRGTHLRIAGGDFWGVGLLPLGFARFIDASASDYADCFRDASELPEVGYLRAALERLAQAPEDIAGNTAMLDAVFGQRLAEPLRQERTIIAIHDSVLSDEIQSNRAMAKEIGVSGRTLERLCRRYFGFSPQLLRRRQRFLRSLARYMVDPSMKWIDLLDSHYHDQAQFVREFRHFMGMRPREYAAMPHPIAQTAINLRRATLGEPMQVLHPAIKVHPGQASGTSGV